MHIRSINIGSARRLRVGERSLLTGIGKVHVNQVVPVGRLGLQGDEQVDLSIHGGLQKAVYAYPAAHYAFWQARRREHGVSLFDEALPPGFVGENLTVDGPLEHEIFVGDELHFPDCVLRVTSPREPCHKFNAVMGFAQAGRAMAIAGCCGYYLAVDRPGTLAAGQVATLVPGQRGLSIAQAFAAKFAKHLR
ncbi:MOSC domain-containing protein [Acidovorax sp. sic0104]|jgi:MOSC domain-containing protein YiiM|uniref:MOSC domain-containing protein n=1 Tax=Acidovorax sp. sic0104 TaxID=2854784 RepID=UPI001C44EB84|nr:MOSC domain-containing protein [Acidovorax sp. sic0104]MBV7542475.1 MOSC domain-containing protein [Acidovorax sp. sic0104]